ncbi:hypothetical protein ACHWQZ_G010021 [Mnemiopsis leidyi]
MYREILSIVLLVTACYYGDRLLQLNSNHGALLRAITDNMIHGSLAVIIWLLGYMSHVDCCQSDVRSRHLGNGLAKHTVVILQSVVCGVLSCAVDIDHFLAAGSFEIQDALHAPHRGILHNTGLLLVLLLLYRYKPRSSLVLLSVSLFSHQLRDAVRRGLSFSPIYSTPPLPYQLFLFLMCAVMLSFRHFLPTSTRTIDRHPAFKNV